MAHRPEFPADGYGAGARIVPYAQVLQVLAQRVRVRSVPIRPKDIQTLTQCLAARSYAGLEKRNQPRHRVAAPVDVLPLDPDFRLAGNPVRTMLTSVSSGGAAFIQTRHVPERLWLMDFAPAGVDLQPAIFQVTRIQPMRTAFEVAGKFLSRVAQELPS